MKILLIALCFIPVAAQLQVCDSVVTKTDKFTGKTSISFISPYVLESPDIKNTIAVNAICQSKQKYIGFASAEIGCTDGNSRVIALFDDGSKVDLVNGADFACDGTMWISMRGMYPGAGQSQWSLCDKRIKSLRLSGRTETIDLDLDPEDSETLFQMLRCWKGAINK